jgi:hypothetical protein
MGHYLPGSGVDQSLYQSGCGTRLWDYGVSAVSAADRTVCCSVVLPLAYGGVDPAPHRGANVIVLRRKTT